MTTQEAQRTLRHLTRHKQRVSWHKTEEMIQFFHEGDPTIGWRLLAKENHLFPSLIHRFGIAMLAPFMITDANTTWHVPHTSAHHLLLVCHKECTWSTTSTPYDHEGFRTEHIAHGQAVLAPILAHIFIHVVCYGFPSTWSTTTIVPIHKAGDPMGASNYRTLMFGHTLTKIYGLVLERELYR